MKVNGNEIRPGYVIEHDGSLWVAVKTQTVKPGKGPAYNQVELKNLIDGRKLNNRFGSDEKVEQTHLEIRDFQYLYKEGDQLVFMDNDTYEQIGLPEDFVGERAAFLQDGMNVALKMHGERPVSISLPEQVVLAITPGRADHEGPDGGVLLQAGDPGERRPRDGAAVHLGGRADRRRHQRDRLHPSRRIGAMARSAILNVMVGAATKAARGLKRDFGEVENLQVSRKGPADFVSAADRRAEEIIRAELERARPGYGFLMEESGETRGARPAAPLDRRPARRHHEFPARHPALRHLDRARAAGEARRRRSIYNPISDELFTAERGAGAFLNDRRLRVAARNHLAEAVIATGMPLMGAWRPGRST